MTDIYQSIAEMEKEKEERIKYLAEQGSKYFSQMILLENWLRLNHNILKFENKSRSNSSIHEMIKIHLLSTYPLIEEKRIVREMRKYGFVSQIRITCYLMAFHTVAFFAVLYMIKALGHTNYCDLVILGVAFSTTVSIFCSIAYGDSKEWFKPYRIGSTKDF